MSFKLFELSLGINHIFYHGGGVESIIYAYKILSPPIKLQAPIKLQDKELQ